MKITKDMIEAFNLKIKTEYGSSLKIIEDLDSKEIEPSTNWYRVVLADDVFLDETFFLANELFYQFVLEFFKVNYGITIYFNNTGKILYCD